MSRKMTPEEKEHYQKLIKTMEEENGPVFPRPFPTKLKVEANNFGTLEHLERLNKVAAHFNDRIAQELKGE